jgi:hypothetical protein
MAGEIKLNDVSVATENAGTVTIAPNNVTFAANHAGIKAALNASGNPGIYACRAWVNFNGTGTVAIRASGNVSSITDDGPGLYQVNFTTPMPDTDYCLTGSGSRRDNTDDGNSYYVCFRRLSSVAITTSAAPILTTDQSTSIYGNLNDPEIVCCAFFR